MGGNIKPCGRGGADSVSANAENAKGIFMEKKNEKIMFCRIAWMEKYDGHGEMTGGGEYVRQNDYGAELYNFYPSSEDGKVYGYARNTREKIYIERLGAASGAEKIDGVTVVWAANNPHRENRFCIVGWYENATVFRELQVAPKSLNRKPPEGHHCPYNMLVVATDATLLPVGKRTKEVPQADESTNGFGRANVWYAEERPDFVKETMEYIKAWHSSGA
jgi:hypothetical protein